LISTSCWLFGATAGLSLGVGIGLAQAGEFSLIILDNAYRSAIITDATLSVTIAIVVLSLIATPGLVRLGGWCTGVDWLRQAAPWVARPVFVPAVDAASSADQDGLQAIVAGYGPAGRTVTRELESAGVRCTVIELNPATFQAESRAGRRMILGDASNPEVLEAAGIDQARALFLTIPDDEAAAQACAAARRRAPQIFIAARTHAISREPRLRSQGANQVAVDETAVARMMLDEGFEHLGITRES
jgi:CPA2 family monovalent cation:H+ antiporter-2